MELARQGVEALNEKYRSSQGDSFFLFHRLRRWNPHEQIWMGYERKRGKLAALNSFFAAAPRIPSQSSSVQLQSYRA